MLFSRAKSRMIAPGDVVAAAERLHEADHAVHAEVLHSGDLPNSERWTQLRRVQTEARRSLLDASRKALGLGAAIEIGHVSNVRKANPCAGRPSREIDVEPSR